MINKKNKDKKIKLKEFKEKKHLIKPIVFFTFLILLQIALIFYIYKKFESNNIGVNSLWALISFIMVIYFINMDHPIDYKVAWIIPITIAPIPTIVLYIVLEILPGPKQITNKLLQVKLDNSDLLKQDENIHQIIKKHPEIDYGLERYISDKAHYPIYQNTSTKYLPTGEIYFENLKNDLLSAKKFILIEYFIVKPGKMLDDILEILIQKIDEGVEVRMLIDGMNGYGFPEGYIEYLESLGITVRVFSPVIPILSTYHNNRDHRKIVVIDNRIGYTGGVNISDEYINEVERFGYWKDNGLRIEGEAVKNMTVMFFYLWNLNSAVEVDINKYISDSYKLVGNYSFVQPFDDAPNDSERVGENVYIDILNQAKEYVYIMTPYLIPSENVLNALRFASKRGVDVRIIIPGIPDKKIPYAVARSYYKVLISSGVKIYEFEPGFLHSKSIVSDDLTCVVGSINLDYRSFHLNYENGILVYGNELANEMLEDFIETEKISKFVTLQNYKKLNIFYRLFGKVARLVAPLM